MKVVLFCGGLGMRMRDGAMSAPKPMAMIGDRPLLWHVMRYYAHYGHRDFVLCLGYGAQAVKDFFLSYDETRSNDFVLQGTGDVELFKTDIADWRITFVDTGLRSEIGERLRRVRRFVEGEEMFLANYADVFTDALLPDMISRFTASDAAMPIAAPIAVSATPCRTTPRRTSASGAPSATRMPISRVLFVTSYASSPYSPMEASNRESNPNRLDRWAIKRSWNSRVSIWCVCVSMSTMGRSGPACRTTLRTAGISDCGSPAVRSSNVPAFPLGT